MCKRCPWAKSQLDIDYHDNEWGVPLHDDAKLFELLILECMQAGLSWSTILNKREGMRKAFDNFDPVIISQYGEEKIIELLQNPSIIRNKGKVNAAIGNAIAYLKIKEEFKTFDKFIWSFVGGKPIINHFDDVSEVPANTEISDKMSKELKKRGFKFVGSTICYAFMQSSGMVNDHLTWCHKREN